MSKETLDPVHAAGALVWRIGEQGLEVLAVHRPRYNDWSWPKGKLEAGETLPACAVREVAEETGAVITLGFPLPTLRYEIVGGKTKVVHYWAAHVTDKGAPSVEARAKVKKAPKHEIDEVAWLSVEQARDMITFELDLKPLERLVAAHQAGLLHTRTLVVTRHARARRRKGWTGNDQRRPITKGGFERAHELRGLFAAFGIERLASSPALRCVQTMLPYASSAGLTVRGIDDITEEAFKLKPQRTTKAFEEWFAKKRSRALCVHRPTLPALMDVLARAVTPQTQGKLPQEMPYLPAGGALVLHVIEVDGPRIVAIERHGLAPGV